MTSIHAGKAVFMAAFDAYWKKRGRGGRAPRMQLTASTPMCPWRLWREVHAWGGYGSVTDHKARGFVLSYCVKHFWPHAIFITDAITAEAAGFSLPVSHHVARHAAQFWYLPMVGPQETTSAWPDYA
jgi:hypothetical protein